MYISPDTVSPIVNFSELSKRLTGTTGSNPINGIFTSGARGAENKITRCHFNYGDIEKKFDFPVVDFANDDVLSIEDSLKSRIQSIKNWIKTIDYEEELEFSV
jgi:hypothetical protein